MTAFMVSAADTDASGAEIGARDETLNQVVQQRIPAINMMLCVQVARKLIDIATTGRDQ